MITTALTHMFGLEQPIVLAPMGGVSGGRLAAAVSNAGGLGLVGGGYGDAGWLRTELSRFKDETDKPWGVGLITWSVDAAIVDLVLGYRPHAVMLSFGDPRPHAARIKAAACRLICQVQDLAGARLAVEAGADIIVAQGTEAGGHGGGRSTLPLVPAVVDAVAPIPVVAAGGIADGRGLAAALMLGAHGALIGTRFYASEEALGHDRAKQRIAAARGDETTRTNVFDVVRGLGWPDSYTGRALRNRFMERWHGREGELSAALDIERGAYQAAARVGDVDTAVVWAGEAIDLIASVERAATLVRRIGAEAQERLTSGAGLAQRRAEPAAGMQSSLVASNYMRAQPTGAAT
jgi:nitronate monooxygenase